jgi:hypothetical protein
LAAVRAVGRTRTATGPALSAKGNNVRTGLSRGLAFLAILVLALIPAAAQQPHSDTVRQIEIHAQAIEAFEPREPLRTRFGALVFRGGLVLESSARDFGGLSGLHVEPDGEHFVAISDRTQWLRGRIVTRGGAPVAIADAEMAPMLGPDGRLLKNRGWYDTEALAEYDGRLYVGIERVDRIVRFNYLRDGLNAHGHSVPVPGAMKGLPYNQSIECLAAVPKDVPQKDAPPAGTLIVVSERGLDADGNLRSFLIGREDGTFSLKRTDDFDISDCAIAPNGHLMVLERRFSWTRGIAMRIRSIPLETVKPGALVDGTELIFADMGYQIDNMEGLSVHRAADGSLVLTIISDDNFSPLQRTLLLQFTLAGE